MFYLSLGLLHDLQVPHVCSLILSILLTLDLTNNQQQPTVTADKQTRNQLTAADMLAAHMSSQVGPRRTTGSAADLKSDRQIRDNVRQLLTNRLASKTSNS